jgi:peptidyl-prolyl cis-trans isomerase SurA
MKYSKHSFALIAWILVSICANAQNIFSYGGTQVGKEEFLRMYTKNSMAKKVDMSDKALREYVTLYSRFKMKVAEAEAKKIDTLPSIISELDNYKKQLSKGYLTDKEVINALTKETYERLKKDVDVAHIMITLPKGAQDTMRFAKLIDSIYNAINKGADFTTLAKAMSQDKSTAQKGGDIGYITALQVPYEFETVAYNTPIGKMSKPFRTPYGYHIIKKLGERPAKGEVQVAQIMLEVRKSFTDEQRNAAKAKADSILATLKKGADWNEMVKAFSQDKFSVSNNGELQPFAVNTMSADFENAAFNIAKPGEFAGPVLTDYGYHIIKLLKKMQVRPFDSMKNELTKKIERDGRVDLARVAFLNKVKSKGDFKEFPENLTQFINAIPDTCVKNGYLLMTENVKTNQPLFALKNKPYDYKKFYEFIMASSRGRLFGEKANAIKGVYTAFVEKSLTDFEENNLATENPEFRNLLKEYRDGIILFELTDKSVWTKASTDSAGLAEYFAGNKAKYQWGPSFEGRILRCGNEKDLTEMQTLLRNFPIDTVIERMNLNGALKVNVEEGKFEYEKLDKAALAVAERQYSVIVKNNDGSGSVYCPTKIIKTTSQKVLADARGYVIADYQDYLEKKWIADMEAKYPVKINEAVLKAMVKK